MNSLLFIIFIMFATVIIPVGTFNSKLGILILVGIIGFTIVLYELRVNNQIWAVVE